MPVAFGFRSMVAELHRWRDLVLLGAVMEGRMNTTGERRSSLAPIRRDETIAQQTIEEETGRVWIVLPDRWRLDVEIGGGRTFRQIVNGTNWRLDNPWLGVERGEGVGDHRQRATLLEKPPFVDLWSPETLLFPRLHTEVSGEQKYLGRTCVVFDARPLDTTPNDRFLWEGADRYSLILDEQTRTILKLTAFLHEQPFAIEEVLSVEFDTHVDDDVFAT